MFVTIPVDISVIFCQYNPIFEKTACSLYSLVTQKGIKLEIIIVDDGSTEDYFDDIKAFFEVLGFSDYVLHKNQRNIGTVKNLMSGIELSRGKYVFVNSPGDILSDDYALRDYYQFAVHHNANCLFANAVYYKYDKENCLVLSTLSAPPKPKAFGWKMPRCFGKYALFRGDSILGSVFLRKREYAVKYITKISETAKYVEDYTSSFLSVMEGERIIYFNRVVLWYETGSTRPKEIEKWWYEAIKKDVYQTRMMIKQIQTAKPYFEFVDPNMNKILRIIKHPLLSWMHLIYYSFRNEMTVAPTGYEKNITEYINGVVDTIRELGRLS